MTTQFTENDLQHKIEAQQWKYTQELNYYFGKRHNGFYGINDEQVVDLVKFNIKQLRIWKEMENRCKTISWS